MPRSQVATTGSTNSPAPAHRPRHLWLDWIDAPVVRVTETGRALTPPDDPRVLGWWGQPADSEVGTTLLVGHTVHTGGGQLDDLEDVPIGAVVHIGTGRHRIVRYRVVRNVVITKAELARRSSDLFAQDGPSKLVVVTCEGYDPATGEYHDNVVLIATPLKGM